MTRLSEQFPRAARGIVSTSSLGTALAGAVRPALVPHGFTLTMWGAGMLAVGTAGPPRGIEVVLCIAAALVGSGVIAVGAAGLSPGRNPGQPVTALTTPPFLPVALSLLVSTLIVHTTSGPLTWTLLGASVTTTYFLALAGQLLLVAHFRGRPFEHQKGGQQ